MASRDRKSVESELGSKCEEAVVSQFKEFSPYVSGKTEENHEMYQSRIVCP
jgi:hypothetical protein